MKSTGEGNLKKMLCNGKMTEVHLRLLIKIARALKDDEFATHAAADTFPKVKLGAPEIAIKEGFWKIALEAAAKVGLVTPQAMPKAA